MPPQNHLVFVGFGYTVDSGERNNQTGESEPIKVLTFIDQSSMLKLSFVFSLPEFEEFEKKTAERRITIAHELPKITPA